LLRYFLKILLIVELTNINNYVYSQDYWEEKNDFKPSLNLDWQIEMIGCYENLIRIYELSLDLREEIIKNMKYLNEEIGRFENFGIKKAGRKLIEEWEKMRVYRERIRVYGGNIEIIMNTKDIKIGKKRYSVKELQNMGIIGEEGIENIGLAGYNILKMPEIRGVKDRRDVIKEKFSLLYGFNEENGGFKKEVKKKIESIGSCFKEMFEQIGKDKEMMRLIFKGNKETERMVIEEVWIIEKMEKKLYDLMVKIGN
jgi:hypothetical protein